jgi:hypothetical protein
MGQSKQPAKLAMLIALSLLLLRYEAGNVCCSTDSEDFQALVEFKQGITDTKEP